MKRLFTYLLYGATLLPAALRAGTSPVDELLEKLAKTGEDTNRVNILFQLSEVCDEEDILNYAAAALNLAEKLHYKKGIADAANNVGYSYLYHGDVNKALDYYHRSLDIREEIHDRRGIAESLNNIATVYNDQNDLPKALEYYEKSLALQRETADTVGIARSLNNIAFIYKNMGDVPKSLNYCSESLRYYELAGNQAGIAFVLNNMGSNYRLMNDPGKALEYYQRGLKIREEIKDKAGQAYSLHGIGRVYLDQKDYAHAEEPAARALALSKSLGYPASIGSSAEMLSLIYAETGRYKEAYEMDVLFKEMTDSTNNIETRKATLKKQMQYEFDKKQTAEQLKHEKEMAAAEDQRKRQAIYLWIIVAVGAAVVGITLSILRTLRITRKQRNVIEVQKKLVEVKQREVLDSILYAKRIQDSLLPTKAYIGRHIERLKNR